MKIVLFRKGLNYLGMILRNILFESFQLFKQYGNLLVRKPILKGNIPS